MSRIFMTGASGFIGSHLLQHLNEKNHQLSLLVRTPTTQQIKGRPSLPASAQLIIGDLMDSTCYLQALEEVDTVIHLAADYRVGIPTKHATRKAMYQTNVEGTLLLADAALKAGVQRFIYASTTAAFGETKYSYPNEQAQHNSVFRCYYEETKHIAHQLLKDRGDKGLPLVMAVLGGVFGEGDTSSLTLAMQDFINGKLKVQPDSTSRFQLCHISHVVQAFEMLINHPTPEQAYLFTGKDFSMPEVLSLLSKVTQKDEPKKIDINKLKIPAAVMDFLARFGLRFPLSKEIINIMDGSTYMYSSQHAQHTLSWSEGNTEQELIDYMRFLMEVE